MRGVICRCVASMFTTGSRSRYTHYNGGLPREAEGLSLPHAPHGNVLGCARMTFETPRPHSPAPFPGPTPWPHELHSSDSMQYPGPIHPTIATTSRCTG